MATSALPTGGMIDPTKQAEYPVLLGDRLTGKDRASNSRLININYNYKTKASTAQRQSTITRSSQSRDLYNLSVTEKPPNAENNTLTYLYEGSVDPAEADRGSEVGDYALVFDSDRKVFVLEPVAAPLNFNLRSAPAKTEKQVMEQYEQLRTLQDDLQSSGEDQAPDGIVEEDEGPADGSNPYDFRHFLPDADDENDQSSMDDDITDPLPNIKKSDPPSVSATAKPAPSPKPRPKPQANPLPQKKTEPVKKKAERPRKTEPPRRTESAKKTELPGKTEPRKTEPPPAKPSPKPEAPVEVEEVEEPEPEPEPEPESKSSPSDTGSAALSSHKAVPSPGSNIIIDGDLIIDMGSPPPSRPTFKVNPAHFSSNNTPSNGAEEEDGDEEMEDLRLPSPAGHGGNPTSAEQQEEPAPAEEELEDDDALAAEMEAAFEESAREEENTLSQPYQQSTPRAYNAASDDESEVSEEE